MGICMKGKLVFFSKGDDKFINEIIESLSVKYETKKIIIKTLRDASFIDLWMKWADICWFEWCDELLVYGSKLEIAGSKKIICRLHSYEAFTQYPLLVNWQCVKHLIFVSKNIQNYVVDHFGINKDITTVIPNGIDMSRWIYRNRENGFNIAFVGYINYKKGPMLLLQAFKAVYDLDNRFKLYIAGQYQDPRYELYFRQMVKEWGLENNFFYEGWQSNIDQWLEDKNYILCTSVLESQNLSVMQAMAKGIKPVIHNFAGAEGIYDKKYLWNTIGEAVQMISDGNYDSEEYRSFIGRNYPVEKQLEAINGIFGGISAEYPLFGEIYNEFLYRSRLDLLDAFIKKVFTDISSKKVLEYGPGTGIFTGYFLNKGVRDYTAVDIASVAAKELQRQYKEYCFIQGDICEDCPDQNKYHLIFAANVLQNITNNEQFEKAIGNISGKLEDDGLCIIFEPISLIHARDTAAHVKIRDREYLAGVFREYHMELSGVLPVTYFMNEPFDAELAGALGEKAHQLFETIVEFFAHKDISDADKKNVGEYLYCKDRQLLFKKGFGLSEKLVIARKQREGPEKCCSFKELPEIDTIDRRIKGVNERIGQSRITENELFIKINLLLSCLDMSCKLPMEYVRSRMDLFFQYDTGAIDNYDFKTAGIMLGKRERASERYELIEFILNNDLKEKLVVTNVWYDLSGAEFILPEQMRKSINAEEIIKIAESIVKDQWNFKNGISGFIFDRTMAEEVRKNSLAYTWKKGIPASEFLPVAVYLKIIEKYIFAAGFIHKDSNVLEAPCGFGYGAAYFSGLCGQMHALDAAEENIDFAKQAYRNSNINWVQGAVTCLPFQAEALDVYVSYEVLESLPVERAEKYIEEACRVLKKSGRFIISTPNRDMRKHVNNPFHIKEYTFDEFSGILKKVFSSVDFYSMSGFRVEKDMNPKAHTMIAVCGK